MNRKKKKKQKVTVESVNNIDFLEVNADSSEFDIELDNLPVDNDQIKRIIDDLKSATMGWGWTGTGAR